MIEERTVAKRGWSNEQYQNVMANPHATIDSGGRRTQAIAERLAPEAAEQELVGYSRRYPIILLKVLAKVLGYRLDGTEAGVRAWGQILPMVALKPEKE